MVNKVKIPKDCVPDPDGVAHAWAPREEITRVQGAGRGAVKPSGVGYLFAIVRASVKVTKTDAAGTGRHRCVDGIRGDRTEWIQCGRKCRAIAGNNENSRLASDIQQGHPKLQEVGIAAYFHVRVSVPVLGIQCICLADGLGCCAWLAWANRVIACMKVAAPNRVFVINTMLRRGIVYELRMVRPRGHISFLP